MDVSALRQQYELSDFGAKLDVAAPPADTFDAARAIAGALASVAGQATPG